MMWYLEVLRAVVGMVLGVLWYQYFYAIPEYQPHSTSYQF